MTPISSIRTRVQQAPSLIANLHGPSLDSGQTFVRNLSAAVCQASGTYAQAAANAPRFSFDPTTHASQGLLMEEQRTNLCLRGNNMTNAAWVRTTMNATASNGADPYGGTSYCTVTASGANATSLQTITVTSGVPYTFSIDITRVTGTGTIQITMDNGTTWTTVAVTSTLTRFSVTQTTTSTSAVVGIRIVTSGDSLVVGGAQLEQGSFATSRITTTSATVQRPVDQLTYSLPSPFYNDGNNFAATVKLIPIANTSGTAMQFLAIGDGTTNNQVVFGADGSNNLQVIVYVGGVTTTYSTSLQISYNVVNKCGISISNGLVLVSLNGVVATASAGAPTSAAQYTTMNIGPTTSGCMYVQRIRLFRHPVAAGHLASLTAS